MVKKTRGDIVGQRSLGSRKRATTTTNSTHFWWRSCNSISHRCSKSWCRQIRCIQERLHNSSLSSRWINLIFSTAGSHNCHGWSYCNLEQTSTEVRQEVRIGKICKRHFSTFSTWKPRVPATPPADLKQLSRDASSKMSKFMMTSSKKRLSTSQTIDMSTSRRHGSTPLYHHIGTRSIIVRQVR